MGKNQHVTPHNSGWQVKGAGNSKATAVTKTQAEAITIAKSIANNFLFISFSPVSYNHYITYNL